MFRVTFDGAVHDSLLEYAVIASRFRGQWIFCKHRERDTWEFPGGRREPGEAILETAKRELYEETGALDYGFFPIGTYSVTDGRTSHGFLCYAEVKELGPLPPSEIECIRLYQGLPALQTYPLLEPPILERVQLWLAGR